MCPQFQFDDEEENKEGREKERITFNGHRYLYKTATSSTGSTRTTCPRRHHRASSSGGGTNYRGKASFGEA